MTSIRVRLLQAAQGLVSTDRNNQYGPPTQDFDRTAAILTALGYVKITDGRLGDDDTLPECTRPIRSHDVAIIQSSLKLSRVSWRPEHEDSWTDMAGYAACGWECSLSEMYACDHRDHAGGHRPKPESSSECWCGIDDCDVCPTVRFWRAHA